MASPSNQFWNFWKRTGAGAALIAAILGLVVLFSLIGSRGASAERADVAPSWINQRIAGLLAGFLVDPPRPGEKTVPQIRFEQPWSQFTFLSLAAISVGLIVWVYRRERSVSPAYRSLLAGMRIALALLLLLCLSEAVLSVERTGLPTFAVLVDDSASASVADPYEDATARTYNEALARSAGNTDATRLAVAQGWLLKDNAQLLRELQAQHRLRLYSASSGASLIAEVNTPEQIDLALNRLRGVQPTGAQSLLGNAVREVLTELRGTPPTAILFLTDGRSTDGESLSKAAEFARSKGVPIFPIGLGDPSPVRDLELSDLQVDEVAFVNDQVRFQARLSSRGFSGEQVEVRLLRRAASTPQAEPTEIDKQTVTAPPEGETTPIELKHTPTETGEFIYELRTAPRPREIQTNNNQVGRSIQIREEKIRVLLVDSQPRYEFRYLLSFLKRDKTIDLRTVLQSADPEFSAQEASALPTFPSTQDGPDGLFSFDVVVFGDVDLSLLSKAQARNLVEFVERKGGGLVLVAGQFFNPLSYRSTDLESLLPIRLAEARDPVLSGAPLTSFRPALTAEGRSHPIFRIDQDEASSILAWDNLPTLDWFLEAPRKLELAFVLATHPSLSGSDGPLPLILYQYVGAGKVLFQGFDDSWKWRFRVGDRYFGRYWIQAIRFLARSKLLGKQAEISTDRRQYQRQQPVRIQVRFPNPALAPSSGVLNVQISRTDSSPQKLQLKRSQNEPSHFEGILSQAAQGEHEVKLLPPPLLEGGMPTTRFTVAPPAGEFEQIPMAEAELVRTASVSRGKFHTPAVTREQLLQDLPPPQMVPLDTDPPIPLWNTPATLAIFLTLLAAEWLLRKRKQMV